LDFETASEADLKCGMRKYMRHSSTRVLTACIKIDGTMHRLTGNFDQLPSIVNGRTIVAHNASFDASVWDTVLKLPPVAWRDTLPMARAAGYPGGLDKLSLAVGGRGKDKNGSRLIDMLCILKPGKPAPVFGPAHELLLEYNVQDVEELERIYEVVKNFGEPEVIKADRIINDRGIPIDVDILHKLDDMYAENQRINGKEFDDKTHVNPKSPKQVIGWLAERGFKVDSINKPAMHKLLTAPEDYFVGDSEMEAPFAIIKEAIELRREIAGVGRGKIDAALKLLDDDDRIRDQLIYYGAHTGRWTSRGLQFHNMPSVIKHVDVRTLDPSYGIVKAAADKATLETGVQMPVSDILNTMLRRFVRADNICAADYGAVEARCLAWVANEHRMLDLFSDPKASVYTDMGAKVFGHQINKKDDPAKYTLAKALVLGCGYGMSGKKFEYMVRLRHSQDDIATLDRAGVKAGEAVKAYRASYPAIPAIWDTYHKAIHACVGEGQEVYAGRCKFKPVGKDMHIILPSGRPIVYRNARIEMQVPLYCKIYGMPEIAVPTVMFDNPRGGGFLYGARTCENICQGICRDLEADTVVIAEKDGLTPIIHVHDEVVNDGPEDQLDHLLRIMSVGPEWAEGFPLLVEGYSGPQWTKNPTGYIERSMLNGEFV
jgi:DNA polymerase bacteriophage-type